MTDQDLQQFAEEIHPLLQQYQREQIDVAHDIIQKCLYTEQGDFKKLNNFIECMSQSRKQVEKEIKFYKIKLAYQQEITYDCFKNAKIEKDKQICKQNMRDQITNYQETFKQNIIKMK